MATVVTSFPVIVTSKPLKPTVVTVSTPVVSAVASATNLLFLRASSTFAREPESDVAVESTVIKPVVAASIAFKLAASTVASLIVTATLAGIPVTLPKPASAAAISALVPVRVFAFKSTTFPEVPGPAAF